ncbi:hypothetical protein COP1_018943 [Malus domestica]
MLLRNRLLALHISSFLSPSPLPPIKTRPFTLSFRTLLSNPTRRNQNPHPKRHVSAPKATANSILDKTVLFMSPGVDPAEGKIENMVLPGSNIVLGPYAGDAKIKEVEFVKSSARAKECPKHDRPEFAILGRSNVGKSLLINSLVRKKDVVLIFLYAWAGSIIFGSRQDYNSTVLTSKKPGKTKLVNHFLVNKSWYFVDLPGYGDTLVTVLLLVDASVPPQKIDLDCANWLGHNNILMTFVFTKCDKMRAGKGKRADENLRDFQQFIKDNYHVPPPWIMTSSVTGLGRDELLLHMSQLRNYWDQ